MKNLTKSIVACLLSSSSLAFAVPVTTTIADNFIGGRDAGAAPIINRDVISEDLSEAFNIDNMQVTIDRAAGTIAVKIVTEWHDPSSNGTFNFGDGYDVQTGDLFISTNGWAPFGAAPYVADDASNGEDWEYVFDTSNGSLYGGAFGISKSQDEMTGSLIFSGDGSFAYRDNQETRRSTGGTQSGIGAITWSTNAENDADGIAYVIYSFALADIGIVDPSSAINLGFHWTMTCGNDVIEGGITSDGGGGGGGEVPEPGTLLLAGLGLVGLGLRRRTK